MHLCTAPYAAEQACQKVPVTMTKQKCERVCTTTTTTTETVSTGKVGSCTAGQNVFEQHMQFCKQCQVTDPCYGCFCYVGL
jgi:hypothetical protein